MDKGKILWKIKWFFFSIWIKLTCKMPSEYILTMTFPKRFISEAYTNLVQDPTDLNTEGWETPVDIRTTDFDKLVVGHHVPEVNATYDYLKIYEYHKPNYYNIKLNLFDYIIKNSRMRKVKCVYDSQKGSEIKNLHRQKES